MKSHGVVDADLAAQDLVAGDRWVPWVVPGEGDGLVCEGSSETGGRRRRPGLWNLRVHGAAHPPDRPRDQERDDRQEDEATHGWPNREGQSPDDA